MKVYLHSNNARNAFSLLEILLAIAIIAILTTIVIVAINPSRQLAQARDAQRRAGVHSLYKALQEYLIDNGGYPSPIAVAGPFFSWEICNTHTDPNCDNSTPDDTDDDTLNLTDSLVPSYLSDLPVDPDSSESNSIGYVLKKYDSQLQISSLNYEDEAIVSGFQWTPNNISSLARWWASDEGVVLEGEYVASMTDLSGNGVNAVKSNNATSLPLFVENVQNGKPAIRFDGVNDILKPVNIPNGPRTIVLVANRISTGHKHVFSVCRGGATAGSFDILDTGNTNGWDDTLTVGSIPKGYGSGLYIETLILGSSGSVAYKNGGNQVTDANVFTATNGNHCTGIGGRPLNATTSDTNAQLDFFEMLIFNEALEDTDRQMLEDYLSEKYNIDLAN